MQELYRRLDLIGLGLAGAAAVWVSVAGLMTGGRQAHLALLMFTCMAVTVATRHAPRVLILPILALVAAAPIIIAVLTGRALVGSGPLSGPLGYANANGAQFFIGAGAALAAARLIHRPSVRIGAYLIAGTWILIPWLTWALAASLLGIVLVLSVGLLRRPESVRLALLVGAGLPLAGLLTSVVIGSAYERGGNFGAVDRLLHAALTETRVALWHDAVDLIASEPLIGVGPGRFSALSPTARADRDTRWAHNEYLQVAAETGLPGLALLLGLVLWGFALLWASANARSIAAVVTLSGAALHATIDYVWHFPSVPLALAALVGVGAAIAPGNTLQRL